MTAITPCTPIFRAIGHQLLSQENQKADGKLLQNSRFSVGMNIAVKIKRKIGRMQTGCASMFTFFQIFRT